MTHASKRQTVNIGLFRDGLLNVPKRLQDQNRTAQDRTAQESIGPSFKSYVPFSSVDSGTKTRF